MRILKFVSLLVVSCAVCLASDTFSRLNESLKNDAAIKFYANCFLDRGPCSGDGRAVKWLLPDLVASNCGKCSTKQRRVACKIISILQQKKHSEIWNALLKKFDPRATHRKNLESFNKNCEIKFKIVVPKEEDEPATATATGAAAATTEVNKKIHEEDEQALHEEYKKILGDTKNIHDEKED